MAVSWFTSVEGLVGVVLRSIGGGGGLVGDDLTLNFDIRSGSARGCSGSCLCYLYLALRSFSKLQNKEMRYLSKEETKMGKGNKKKKTLRITREKKMLLCKTADKVVPLQAYRRKGLGENVDSNVILIHPGGYCEDVGVVHGGRDVGGVDRAVFADGAGSLVCFGLGSVTQDQIMLRAFPESLPGAASRWLRNQPSGSITNWEGTNTIHKIVTKGRREKKKENFRKKLLTQFGALPLNLEDNIRGKARMDSTNETNGKLFVS
ncbi:hypothetical protein Tco_0511204 [Tanacetum coccineum]